MAPPAALLAEPGYPTKPVRIIFAAALREPDVRATYESSGAEPVSGSPQEVAELIKRETEIGGRLLRDLGISLEQ